MISTDPIKMYKNGKYNCAQATVATILHDFNDKEEDTITHTFTLLGNGVTDTGTCGILLGSLAALGKILTDQGLEGDQLEMAYKEVTNEFILKFKSYECHKILGVEEDAQVNYSSKEVISSCSPRMEEMVSEVEKLIEFRTNPTIPIMKRFNFL